MDRETWRDDVHVEYEIGENDAHVICEGTQIRTKAQFLDAVDMQKELDSGEWKISGKILANTWNGQLKGGYPIQMFQFKAKFIKTDPKPVLPAIEPINVNLGELPEPRPNLENSNLLLHITDPHFGFSRNVDTGKLEPYHDRRALSILLQIARMVDFNAVAWGGDILDFAEWSSHYTKSPEFYWTTKPALLEAAWWIGQIVKANPNAEHVAMAGNHEERLPRAIQDHLPAAYGLTAGDIDVPQDLLSLPTLLGLEKMGVKWVGEYPSQHFIVPGLSVEHGKTSSKNPGYAAWKIVSESIHSRLYGHGHKREIATKTLVRKDGDVQEITAASPGCLCRIDGTVPGHDPVAQHWTQGVGIAEYSEDGLKDYRIVQIINGKAKMGYWLEAGDELEMIKQDTGWAF